MKQSKQGQPRTSLWKPGSIISRTIEKGKAPASFAIMTVRSYLDKGSSKWLKITAKERRVSGKRGRL